MKSKNKHVYFSIAAFVLATIVGISLADHSWNGMVYFYNQSDHRVPAAIHKVFDFSHLKGHALKMASQKRLLADAQVLTEKDRLGIELGHFVTKSADGRKQFACQSFDRIEMTFESGDMATSGHPSTMTVEAECKAGADINRINPIWIPMLEILSQQAGDLEFQFLSHGAVSLRFGNIGDQWPHVWNLKSVRLYNQNDPAQQFQIGRGDITELKHRPLSLIWED